MFREVGLKNIYTKFSDGNKGWPQKAPFDAIIVTAGAIDIPKCLMDQLSPNGGILLSPVKKNDKQYLKSIEKNDEIISEKIHGTS